MTISASKKKNFKNSCTRNALAVLGNRKDPPILKTTLLEAIGQFFSFTMVYTVLSAKIVFLNLEVRAED